MSKFTPEEHRDLGCVREVLSYIKSVRADYDTDAKDVVSPAFDHSVVEASLEACKNKNEKGKVILSELERTRDFIRESRLSHAKAKPKSFIPALVSSVAAALTPKQLHIANLKRQAARLKRDGFSRQTKGGTWVTDHRGKLAAESAVRELLQMERGA